MGYYGGGAKMNYYKVNGGVIRTVGTLDAVAITKEEFDAFMSSIDADLPPSEPTPEERIAALEKDNAELRESIEALISGVTA